jgi:transposase-like protein
MAEFTLFDDPLQFNPDYTWPKEGTEKDCPKCQGSLTLNEQRPDYKGKPWWCSDCRWQFTDEEV